MRKHKSTVSPKTRPNIDVIFVFLTVFDEYLWYLDGNIINNHKSVVRMRS